MLKTVTRQTQFYDDTDRQVKRSLKIIVRKFNKLKRRANLDLDELNLISQIDTIYDEIIEYTVESLKVIAQKAQKNVTEDNEAIDYWLYELLNSYDPITKYKFYDEAERKKARLREELLTVVLNPLANDTVSNVIEKAKKYWSRQFIQYADNVTDEATIQAYKRNNVDYVVWYAMEDEKVCSTCKSRNGKIYPLSSIPPNPHYGCRCIKIPIVRKN